MGKARPAQFNADETRVIVQYGSKVHSFRLLLDCPKIERETTKCAKIGLARLAMGEQADPEAVVCLVLDQKNADKIYRCGGPGEFEPQEGKFNYWVTDITHRDPSAPQLTEVRDAWEFNYQLYPQTLVEAITDKILLKKKGETTPDATGEKEDTEEKRFEELFQKPEISSIIEKIIEKMGTERKSESETEVDVEFEPGEDRDINDMPMIEEEFGEKIGDKPRKKREKKRTLNESAKPDEEPCVEPNSEGRQLFFNFDDDDLFGSGDSDENPQ